MRASLPERSSVGTDVLKNGAVTLRAMPTNDEPLWEHTPIQNLLRYRPSGTYFARFKVGGKLIKQSLETAVFSVAKQRLPEKMREYRRAS